MVLPLNYDIGNIVLDSCVAVGKACSHATVTTIPSVEERRRLKLKPVYRSGVVCIMRRVA